MVLLIWLGSLILNGSWLSAGCWRMTSAGVMGERAGSAPYISSPSISLRLAQAGKGTKVSRNLQELLSLRLETGTLTFNLDILYFFIC